MFSAHIRKFTYVLIVYYTPFTPISIRFLESRGSAMCLGLGEGTGNSRDTARNFLRHARDKAQTPHTPKFRFSSDFSHFIIGILKNSENGENKKNDQKEAILRSQPAPLRRWGRILGEVLRCYQHAYQKPSVTLREESVPLKI